MAQPRAAVLDQLGVPHAGAKDVGVGYIPEFLDPDDIALEVFAPEGWVTDGVTTG